MFSFSEDFPFEDIKIPTVHVSTDSFDAEVYEMYEMPSGLVIDILGTDGPLQMELMTQLFRLAIVDPSKSEKLDVLSFNEMASAMFQWYKQSNIKIKHEVPASEAGKLKDRGPRTLSDILSDLNVIEKMKEENDNAPEEKKFKLDRPFNDPGDGAEPEPWSWG